MPEVGNINSSPISKDVYYDAEEQQQPSNIAPRTPSDTTQQTDLTGQNLT